MSGLLPPSSSEMRYRAKSQGPTCSQGPRVKKHAEAMDQETRTRSYIQYKLRALQVSRARDACRAKDHEPSNKRQGPRAKDQESQGPWSQGARDQEPRNNAFSI